MVGSPNQEYARIGEEMPASQMSSVRQEKRREVLDFLNPRERWGATLLKNGRGEIGSETIEGFIQGGGPHKLAALM